MRKIETSIIQKPHKSFSENSCVCLISGPLMEVKSKKKIETVPTSFLLHQPLEKFYLDLPNYGILLKP